MKSGADLEWVAASGRFDNGDHYAHVVLVDITSRVLAVIRERESMFHTDVRFGGSDRIYLDLGVAKAYCEQEWARHSNEIADAEGREARKLAA